MRENTNAGAAKLYVCVSKCLRVCPCGTVAFCLPSFREFDFPLRGCVTLACTLTRTQRPDEKQREAQQARRAPAARAQPQGMCRAKPPPLSRTDTPTQPAPAATAARRRPADDATRRTPAAMMHANCDPNPCHHHRPEPPPPHTRAQRTHTRPGAPSPRRQPPGGHAAFPNPTPPAPACRGPQRGLRARGVGRAPRRGRCRHKPQREDGRAEDEEGQVVQQHARRSARIRRHQWLGGIAHATAQQEGLVAPGGPHSLLCCFLGLASPSAPTQVMRRGA